MLQCLLILLLVGGKTVLTKNQLRQIEREAVGVFQRKDIHTGNLFALRLFHKFVEQGDTLIERTQECLLFALDDRDNLLLLLTQFGIGITHILNELRH